MRRSVIGITVVVLALAGCNTMAQSTYQKIKVVTPGVTRADCTLETEKNKYRVLTPDIILVERSSHKMTVTCEKGHYYTAKMEVEPKMRAWHTGWNVLNGVLPGTAWDVADNSIYNYPAMIEVPMELNQDSLDAVMDELTEKPVLPVQKKQHEAEKPEPLSPAAEKTFSDSLRK